MFTAILFTTAKIWKAFKFPSIDKWLKKMWHTYTQWNISHKKKMAILSFATTPMDLEDIMLSEKVRQRKTNTV